MANWVFAHTNHVVRSLRLKLLPFPSALAALGIGLYNSLQYCTSYDM